MTPEVTNVKNLRRQGINHTQDDRYVYIGRPSKWGNPFVLDRWGRNREEVIKQYRVYILSNPDLMDSLEELREKNLVCWCAPLACHGDVLLELANG